MLAYAPKRLGYKHDAYTTRMELAYLDHNAHLNRPQLANKSGEPVYTRRWGKRTKHWHCVPVPTPKDYGYTSGKLWDNSNHNKLMEIVCA